MTEKSSSSWKIILDLKPDKGSSPFEKLIIFHAKPTTCSWASKFQWSVQKFLFPLVKFAHHSLSTDTPHCWKQPLCRNSRQIRCDTVAGIHMSLFDEKMDRSIIQHHPRMFARSCCSDVSLIAWRSVTLSIEFSNSLVPHITTLYWRCRRRYSYNFHSYYCFKSHTDVHQGLFDNARNDHRWLW